MTRITLAAVALLALAATGYCTCPDEVKQTVALVAPPVRRLWNNVEANPFPVALGLGTFLFTVLYHKARGKSLRESVEVAATKVTVVTVPADKAEHENPVIQRAKARATRAQLLTDQLNLQARYRKLPEEINKAEKEACYTPEALAEVERSLRAKQKAHDETAAKLKALRKEKADGDAELGAIEVELKKLAELV